MNEIQTTVIPLFPKFVHDIQQPDIGLIIERALISLRTMTSSNVHEIGMCLFQLALYQVHCASKSQEFRILILRHQELFFCLHYS